MGRGLTKSEQKSISLKLVEGYELLYNLDKN